MPATTRAATGNRSRRPLTQERIVEAALALADARGDFSMRALGQRLRVDPMAIYRHFRDKDALLDAMVDAALAGFEPPAAETGAPLERLRRMCVEFRAALAAHPGVSLRVSTTRPTLGPHTLELTNACVGLLREMGLGARESTRAFLMLIRFITGIAAAEERIRAEGSDEHEWRESLRSAYASLPPAELPHLAMMAGEISTLGFDGEFEFGLDLLLEALTARAARA